MKSHFFQINSICRSILKLEKQTALCADFDKNFEERKKRNYNFYTGTIINYFVQVQIMPELPAAAAVRLAAILERLGPLPP